MNNKFHSFLFGAAMLVAGVALTACGSDDEPSTKKSSATEVTAQPVVYVSDDVLAKYDVVCEFNGQQVTITADNTQPATYTSPSESFVYKDLRKYTGTVTKLTSFPATATAKGTCKLKAGLSLDNFEKIDYTFGVLFEVGNNNDNFWKEKTIAQGPVHSNFVVSKLNDKVRQWLTEGEITAVASFENADSCKLTSTKNINFQ